MSRAFLDSNVWVYASLPLESDPRTRQARELILRLTKEGVQIVIAPQTVIEVINVLRRKGINALAINTVMEGFDQFIWCAPTLSTFIAALHQSQNASLSWFDAALIQLALDANCAVFFSEDMHSGQRFETMQIVNPFAPCDRALRSVQAKPKSK